MRLEDPARSPTPPPVTSNATRSSRPRLCANSSSTSGEVLIRPAERTRPASQIATSQKSRCTSNPIALPTDLLTSNLLASTNRGEPAGERQRPIRAHGTTRASRRGGQHETSSRSKRIVQTGLPGCVLPESPCPRSPDRTVKTGQQPSVADFHAPTRDERRRPARRRLLSPGESERLRRIDPRVLALVPSGSELGTGGDARIRGKEQPAGTPRLMSVAAPIRPTQQRAGAPSGAVESPGGLAPPGALRSRREPLDSPGSCHPAVGCAPDAQCANRPRSRLAIAARNRAVRVGWPRNRLYFRMAQRIRYLLMSLRVWISSVR